MLQSALNAKLLGTLLFATYFIYCILTPHTWHFIDTVNLIFHEAGHAIFFFLPPLITAFMGSGLQMFIPLVCSIYFYRRGEVLSAFLLLFWLTQNIVNVSVYIRDAIPMQLELIGGDSSIHDWNYILGELGLLMQSVAIADILVVAACSTAIVSIYKISAYFIKDLRGRLDEI
jgi:hypothetical protein